MAIAKQNLLNRLTVVVLVLLSTVPYSSVDAAPIEYKLTFYVDTVLEVDLGIPSDPIYEVGNSYSGFFVIDDAILQDDGISKSGDLLQFEIAIEDYFWSMNFPYPYSDFAGFRGPPVGLGAPSPGFDVRNQEIVNLRGGVFGIGDEPFVDFSGLCNNPGQICPTEGIFGNNRFNALLTGDIGRSQGRIQGSLTVARIRVPEPGTLALLGLGLAGIGALRRRRTA